MMYTTQSQITQPPSLYGMEECIPLGSPGVFSGDSEYGMRHILAERYKTKFCRNYIETGMCPYDSRCMFAHGEHELRTYEMNVQDGLVTEEAIRAFRRYCRYVSSSTCKSRRPRKLFPAQSPPYYYDNVMYDYWASECGAPPMMMVGPYTHNPYACNLLPRRSRLYSNPLHALEMSSYMAGSPECYGAEGNGYCSYYDICDGEGMPENNNNETYIAFPMPEIDYASNNNYNHDFNNDDVEASTCSSVGSASEDAQQPTLHKVHTAHQQLGDEAECGTTLAVRQC